MIKEALEFQFEQGKAFASAMCIELPENKVLLVKPGGETQILDKGPAVRKDSVATLKSFIDWCLMNGSELLLDVWVSESRVDAVNDFINPHACDRVSLRLTHSKAWETIASWNQKAFKQREAVRLLRGPLADTFDPQHLRVFKTLDFTRKNDGARSVSHKGESMGRSIEIAAQGREGEIPEVVVFELPCFDFEESPRVHVKMAVEVDADNETIGLFVIGDAFIQGTRAALSEIAGKIKQSVGHAEVYLS